ncbi:unnamed protein product [Cercospora beticola]|nr:unnamed protein product [Cercospora beticola]
MATTGDVDSLTLRDLLESLPQELYDYIYKLTFTAEKKIHVYTNGQAQIDITLCTLVKKLEIPTITLNERFPHLLHVDRASRKQLATSYFGTSGSIFITPVDKNASFKRSLIDAEHFALIKAIHVPVRSRDLQLFMQQHISENEVFAPFRSQAVICLLEDAVGLIEAHAQAYKKAGVEQGGIGSGDVEEIENEDEGAEGVAESL